MTLVGPPSGKGPALVLEGWTTIQDLAVVGQDT
eukprot:SAG22_NODE_13777_length_395_cov_0.878378_1_plen_32_part_01